MKKIQPLFVLCGLVLALVTSRPGHAAETSALQTVTVIGSGNIYQGNVPAARDHAISDSLVSAVGLVAAELMPLIIFSPISTTTPASQGGRSPFSGSYSRHSG